MGVVMNNLSQLQLESKSHSETNYCKYTSNTDIYCPSRMVSFDNYINQKERFRQNKLHWEQIPRANDPRKPLQEKAVNLLAVIVHKLRKNTLVTLNHNYLSRITKCRKDQNVNLLKQLTDILDISFHVKITIGNNVYRNCYVIEHTEKGRDIIENSSVLLTQKHFIGNKAVNPIKITPTEDEKNPSSAEFFPSSSIYKEEVFKNRSKSNFVKNNFFLEKVDVDVAVEVKSEVKIESNNELSQTNQLNHQTKITNSTKFNTREFISSKELKDFYPLSLEDCHSLQSLSKREFSLNAMNEILLDMSRRLADRVFKSKKAFLSYMSKAFTYEMRDAVKTDNETFKINNNKTTKMVTHEEQETYLAEIEYSLQVSPEWHLKKKLACVLEPSKSYELLTAYKGVSQEGTNFVINLNKNVELSNIEKEIILKQVKATHEIIDFNEDEINMIQTLEIKVPNQQNQRNQNNPHKWNGGRGGSDLSTQNSIMTFQDNIWGKIRKALTRTYGDSSDKNWFSKLDAKIDELNKEIILKAPSDFYRDQIERNYFDSIEHISKTESYKVGWAN